MLSMSNARILQAILTTTCIYLAMAVMLTGTSHRLVLLDKFGKSLADGGGMVTSYLSYPPKTDPKTPTVTEVGALLSTIGAGLQALTGAPRLLQAIAKDNLIPLLNPFAVLSGRGEPFRALVATACISEIGILIGQLDLIAPLLSMFFLLFYAGVRRSWELCLRLVKCVLCLQVNVACTVMSLSANPGWRPSFRYYHWSVSMVGVVLCLGAMFRCELCAMKSYVFIFTISFQH